MSQTNTVPFDERTVTVQTGIQEALIDAVIVDRLLTIVQGVAGLLGGETDIPGIDTEYSGHFVAIHLMGFNERDNPMLIEKFSSVYYEVVSKEISPTEAVKLIRESWDILVRQEFKQKSA